MSTDPRTWRRLADRMAALEAENSAARLAADPLAQELARCAREHRERLERRADALANPTRDRFTLDLF